jgi:hypothetical protein
MHSHQVFTKYIQISIGVRNLRCASMARVKKVGSNPFMYPLVAKTQPRWWRPEYQDLPQ